MLALLWIAAPAALLVCVLRWGFVLATGTKASRELVIATCLCVAACFLLVWTAHFWMFPVDPAEYGG